MPGYSLFLAERHRRRRGYPLILVAVVSCLVGLRGVAKATRRQSGACKRAGLNPAAAVAGALAIAMSGCAATGTIAIGKASRARIWNPYSVCPPSAAPMTTTSTVHHEDHLVAADVTDNKTVQEPTPVMDAQGSKISDAFGSIFGAVWSGVRWLFGMP